MFSTKFKKITLLCGDLFVFYFSLYLTLLIRYGEASRFWTKHFFPFSIIFFLWIIVFYIIDLYNLFLRAKNFHFYSLLSKAFAINLVIGIAFFYFLPNLGISPKRILFIYIIISFILIITWRKIFFHFFSSKIALNKILFIGYNKQVKELITKIVQAPQLGYSAVLINNRNIDEKIIKKIKIINYTDNIKLSKIIKENKIQTIVNALNDNNKNITNQFYNILNLKINFLSLTEFYEEITGKIPINIINEIWFLENLKEGEKNFYEFSKRIFDIIFSLIGLLLTIPFLPIIALLIKIDSPGPIFFQQIRTGKNNKNFWAIKFRTMIKDAEKNGAQWAKENDPRITKLGKFFRKTRIDELPQLLNVLRGEMSFIGPRPERPEFIATLEKHIPFYKQRLIVKPGLTGWAQVNFPYGSSIEDSLEKMQYDLFYIKNRSFALDTSIILKTINTILRGGGR